MIGLLMLIAMRYPVFMTGSQLNALCNLPSQAACVAYVIGATDMQDEMASAGQIRSAFCFDVDATPARERDAVTSFLRDHPEKLQQSATSLIVESMSAAFPCPK